MLVQDFYCAERGAGLVDAVVCQQRLDDLAVVTIEGLESVP